MADIQHKNIADSDRHEPKGASTAAAGQVYVSDGAGSGSWQTPAQGSKVLLSTQTAANSAAISFTSLITSTYSTYEIEFYQVRASAGNPGLLLLTSTNNGSSYNTTGYSATSALYNNVGGGTAPTYTSASGAGFILAANASIIASTAANGTVKLLGLTNGTTYKNITATTFNGDNCEKVDGYRGTVTAINAVRIEFDSGNIAAGTFKLYGIV